MRLCYRGASYEYNPLTLEVREEEVIGRYRGGILRSRRYTGINQSQPPYSLKYRGVVYGADSTDSKAYK